MDKAAYKEWIETSTGMTAGYLKANGVTYEQAKNAGMLPRQQLTRHRSALAWLEDVGHGNSPEACHLRHATRVR